MGKLVAYMVIALIGFLLLSSWVHASAPYIAGAILLVAAWKLGLSKWVDHDFSDGNPPDKGKQ
jgi:hypothetical protein